VRTFQGRAGERVLRAVGFQETRFGRHQYQIGQMVSLPPCSNHQLLLGVSRDLLEALALMPRRECIKKWGIRFVPYLGARGD
jgi:hypothetical protein